MNQREEIAMAFVKKCNICGTENIVTADNCIECGAEITFIKPEEKRETDDVGKQRKFRICPVCKTKNYIDGSTGAKVCICCKNDELYRIVPQTEEEYKDIEVEDVTINKKLRLQCRLNGKILEISEDNTILGRNGTVGNELFEGHNYVGQMHCTITYKNNKWYVRDNSSLNHTLINGKKLESEIDYELREGSILTLADIHFIIMNMN